MLKKAIENIDDFSIRTKLILTVVSITLILGVLMGFYLHVVQTNMMKTELNEKGISITRNLAENSVNPILTDNPVRLQWLAETIKESETDVVYVYILDKQGEVLVHTFDGGFPADLYGINPAQKDTQTLLLDTELGYVRDISCPILEGEAGEVHVGMSQESIGSAVNRFTASLGIFVFLLMIAGSNVAYIAGSVVSRPILDLKEGVEIFGKGNLDHKVRIQSMNEVGQLAESFNNMADQIAYLIREKERAAEEVLDTRNYLTKIVSGSLDGIIVTDKAGIIEFVNEAFMQIAEAEKERLIDYDMCLFSREEGENIRNFLNNENCSSSFIQELTFTTMKGNVKNVFLSLSSVQYMNQTKYVAVAKDITQIKKFEQMKRNIISNISHELRTPLNIMKGYVEISLDEKSDEKRNTYLCKSLEALEKQNLMIQDLLEVARNENEMDSPDIILASSNGIIEMALRFFSGKTASSGVNVITKMGEDTFIMADTEKLTYALTKIIDNAIKFTDKGGYVEVGTIVLSDYVKIYVKDTGIGISEKHREHIFEHFYQADGTSTRKFGGNGLGLAIANHIITQHNCKLMVESEPGSGSNFYFVIPRYKKIQVSCGS